MQESDLSGRPLESDAPTTITCHFSDGQRRRLTVTSVEAAQLATKGVDLTRRYQRIARRIGVVARKALPWVAGVVIGSLVLPAVTKQWSDRQSIMAIQARLASDITSKPYAAWTATYRETAKGTKTAHRKVLLIDDKWARDRKSVTGIFDTYFADTHATTLWSEYSYDLWDFIGLGGTSVGALDTLARTKRFMDSHQVSAAPSATKRDWDALRRCFEHPSDGGIDCLSQDGLDAFSKVGIDLLDRGQLVLDELRRTRPSGFSRGTHDFIRDVFSPLT